MTKAKKHILISVLALATMMQAAIAISPVLAELAIAFPNATTDQIQYVYTVSSLASIVSILVVGKLAQNVNNRLLAVIGVALVAIGGLIPVLLHSSLVILYIASFIVGIGSGVANVMSATLISQHFTGITKGTVMGYQSAFLSIGAMVMSVISGQLAGKISWHSAFLTYLLAIPVLVVVFIFLPSDLSAEDAPVRGEEDAAARGGMRGKVWYFVILSFFSSAFMNAFLSSISMFLSDTQLGDASVAGTVSSMFLLLGIPAGILLGKVIKILGRKLMWSMSLMMALALLLVAVSNSLPLVYAAAVLFGIGYAIRNPAAITFVSGMVDNKTVSVAVSLNQGLSALGMFCTPLIVNTLSQIFGGSSRAAFLAAAAGMAVITALYLFANPISRKQADALAADQ